MLQVLRQFSIKIKSKLCKMHPQDYTEGREYEVLAVRDSGGDDDYTWFLIADNTGDFEWINDADCTLGQLHDR